MWPFLCGIEIKVVCRLLWINNQYIQRIKHSCLAFLHVPLQPQVISGGIVSDFLGVFAIFYSEHQLSMQDYTGWRHENESFISSCRSHLSKPSQFRSLPDTSVWTPLSRRHSEGIATPQWTGLECQSRSTSWPQPINKEKGRLNFEKHELPQGRFPQAERNRSKPTLCTRRPIMLICHLSSDKIDFFCQLPMSSHMSLFISQNPLITALKIIKRPMQCLTLMTCSLGSRLQSAKVRRFPSRNFLLEMTMVSVELWSISSGRGLFM